MTNTDSACQPDADIQITQINLGPVEPVIWFEEHTALRSVGPAESTGSDVWAAYPDEDSDEIVALALVDELNETQLHRLGVRPEYRRQGIATAMIRRLYEEYGDLKLVCRESLDANGYYEATGWKHVGTQWGDPDDLNKWELHQPPQRPQEGS